MKRGTRNLFRLAKTAKRIRTLGERAMRGRHGTGVKAALAKSAARHLTTWSVLKGAKHYGLKGSVRKHGRTGSARRSSALATYRKRFGLK